MNRRRRGNSIIETAMWLPFILLLLVGMVQIGKITYVYYTIKKQLYGVGMQVSASQGINFCDAEDPILLAAKNYGLTGSAEADATPFLPTLTADLVEVTTECVDSTTGTPGPCTTGGCDTPGGPPKPDFIVVTIPNGYEVAPRFPYMLVDPILLRPEVRVPYGGG